MEKEHPETEGNLLKKSYLLALLLGLLTVIVCLVIADGMIGVAGTVGDYTEDEFGNVEFTLHVKDPTGKIIFSIGLILLPLIFGWFVSPRHTWINILLYLAAWYVLSAIFGSQVNHRFLAHPSSGFIDFFSEFTPFFTTLYLWISQFVILLTVKLIRYVLRKIEVYRQRNTA